MKMDLIASLLTFTMFWKTSWSLYCFKCEAENTRATPPCSHFNYSSIYLTECPSSTMCYKRVVTMDFGNGLTTQSIHRGCAAQSYDGDQEKINGKWRKVVNIREVYEEKCTEDLFDTERTTKTLHCYCRGDMCNRAEKLNKSFIGLLVMGATLLLLA